MSDRRTIAAIAILAGVLIFGAWAWLRGSEGAGEPASGEARERPARSTAPEPETGHEPLRPLPVEDPALRAAAVERARAAIDPEVAARIGELEAETPDPTWGRAMASAIAEAERVLAAGGSGRVGEIRCGYETCAIGVVWPDYDTAQQDAREWLALPIGGASCERTIRTPMPQDPRLPYAAFLVLRCRR